MRKKKTTSSFDTVIGRNTVLKGDIDCDGSIRVDGSVTGDIKADGDVLLGKEGFIKGKIEAINVHLSGTVEGNIRATGILRIMSSAKLLGNVEVNSFIADEGAVFQGNCKMIDFDEDKPKDKPGRGRKNRRPSKKIDNPDETTEESDVTDEKPVETTEAED